MVLNKPESISPFSLLLFVFLSLVLLFPSKGFCTCDFYILKIPNYFDATFSSVYLDNSIGNAVGGWSFGVCHTPAEFDIVSVTPSATVDSLDPYFQEIALYSQGWTASVIIDPTPDGNVLSPGMSHHLYSTQYELVPGADGIADLTFCDTLGASPVDISIESAGQSHTPLTTDGILSIHKPGWGLSYWIPSPANRTVVHYSSSTGEGAFAVTPGNHGSFWDGGPTTGFSMALQHDPQYLTIESVVAGGALSELNGGAGPEFFSVQLLTNGWTVETYYSSTENLTIWNIDPFYPLLATYSTVSSAFSAQECVATSLDWSSGLGIANETMYDSAFDPVISATLFDESVLIVPADLLLLRGDCNLDGAINLADGIFILNYLFLSGAEIDCADGCDNNDDGENNLADAVYILNYLFANGAAIPPPGNFCGIDTTDDALVCSESACP